MSDLSKVAKQALIFHYVLECGSELPDTFGADPATRQLLAFAQIANVSMAEATCAFAELQDAGMIGRE
jgi:hypothetical protein